MAVNAKYAIILNEIRAEIENGIFGNSGDKFLSVRNLAEKYSVSLVTAQKIIKQLSEIGVITLYGKAYYITIGKMFPASQLKARIENNRKSTDKLIGIHIPKLNNPFFSALLDEVVKSIYNIGYRPVIMCSNRNPNNEKTILEDFIDMGVCGVISCTSNNEILKNRYNNYPLPLVFLANNFSSDKVDFVEVDNKACGRHVALHLMDMGYENFIYIGPESEKNSDKRGKAFVETIKEAGFDFQQENIIYVADDESFAIPYSVSQHIKNCKKPLGIFCYHDIIAVGVIMLCENSGLNIPEEVGIVGFDNLPIAKQCRPTLSSISYRFDKMAEVSVNMLMQKINFETDSNIQTGDFVNHALKIRNSSRKKPL